MKRSHHSARRTLPLAAISVAVLSFPAAVGAQPAALVDAGQGANSLFGHRSLGGGALSVPYAIDPFYGGSTTAHPPPPGTYDPIFGGYTPMYPGAALSDPPPSSPNVVINQNCPPEMVRPHSRDRSNLQLPGPGDPPTAEQAPVPPPTPAAAASADQPTIFLIALQDYTIRPAIAYWVQGDTLNYVTVTRVLNRISLALVDRDLTNQLNGERNVPFRLLAAR